jgi:hypothetical protein
MPQICSICRHEKRPEIDQALLAGEPFRALARRTGTSAAALHRHRNGHLPTALVKARRAAAEVNAETLWQRLKAINNETAAILAQARESQNHVIALQAIARVERQVELEARLLGELSDSAKVAVGININVKPDQEKGNLSRLTDEELRQLEILVRKMHGLES